MVRPPLVQVLGSVRFTTSSGVEVPLPSSSQRRLLALLAISADSTLRSEHISELLGLRSGALRTTVSRLRRRLGDTVILTDAPGYGIGCPVDAARFADLVAGDGHDPPVGDERVPGDRLATVESALALWHGEALDEFRHEPWAEAEAVRLDELRCLATEERFEILLHRGRSGEVVAGLESYLADHPLRDRPWALLMEALAEQGRRSDALRRYQEYRRLLVEETGLEPSNVVRSIERRIAGGADLELEVPHPPPAVQGASGTRPPPVDVPLPGMIMRPSGLIGRDGERAALDEQFAVARSGRLRAVVVSGEAGIGKTTLLGAFALAARECDATVLYGRCEDGGAVPLQPWRDIIGSIVEHAPLELLRDHCERYGGELLRIAPHLAGRLWAPPPLVADGAIERHHLFAAITDLLRRTSLAAPVAVLLDDLHGAEPSALLLLRHLVQALSDAPVLVVVSYRDVGVRVSPELRTTSCELDRVDAVRLRLDGLDASGTAELVAAVVGSDARLDRAGIEQLRDQTAGHPLYTRHLVQHLAERGCLVVDRDSLRLVRRPDDSGLPVSLVEVVWNRVQSLDPGTQAVLRTASVLGVDFDEHVLAAMCDLGEDGLAAALDAAVDAGLLVERDRNSRSMRFTHALVARALDDQLGGPGRRRLHERAANALLDDSDEPTSATVVALARHCELAGDLAAAQRWATLAGDRALEHLAPEEAAKWYSTALDHAVGLGRPAAVADLTARLGEARVRSGDPRADRALLDAAAFARACGAHDVLVRVALVLDHAVMRLTGIDQEHLATVEAALRVADQVDPASHARLLAIYAQDLIHTDRAQDRRNAARSAVALLDAVDDASTLPQMIPALTYALWGPGSVPERRDLSARAVRSADGLDDRLLQFWSHRSAYLVAVEAADAPLAEASMARMHSIVDHVGEPRLRWLLGILDTFADTMAARLDDAERSAEATLTLGFEIGEPDAFTIYAGQLFVIRSFAGHYGDLIPVLEPLVADHPDVVSYRLALAIALAAVGRPAAARTALDLGLSMGFGRIPVDHMWNTTVIGYAVLAIELLDRAAARRLLPLLEPFGGEVAFNGATSQGPISAYLGKLHSLLGDHDAAEHHLRIALDTATDFGWNYHCATTLVALGQAELRRTGGLDATAVGRLDRAAALATRHGLSGVAEQAEAIGALRRRRDRGERPGPTERGT